MEQREFRDLDDVRKMLVQFEKMSECNKAFAGMGALRILATAMLKIVDEVETIKTYDGGGIYTHNSPDLTLRDCNIVNNDAVTGDGGGLYVDYKSVRLTMSNCKLTGNRAATGGGRQDQLAVRGQAAASRDRAGQR